MAWPMSCGLAEVGFLVLPEIVRVDVAVGFEPDFVGLEGEGSDETQAITRPSDGYGLPA